MPQHFPTIARQLLTVTSGIKQNTATCVICSSTADDKSIIALLQHYIEVDTDKPGRRVLSCVKNLPKLEIFEEGIGSRKIKLFIDRNSWGDKAIVVYAQLTAD